MGGSVRIWYEQTQLKNGHPVERILEPYQFDSRWLEAAFRASLRRFSLKLSASPGDVSASLGEALQKALVDTDIYEIGFEGILQALLNYQNVVADRKLYLEILALTGRAARQSLYGNTVRFFVGISRE